MDLALFILLDYILDSHLVIFLVITEHHFLFEVGFTLLPFDGDFVFVVEYFGDLVIAEWRSSSSEVLSILDIMDRLVLFRSLYFLVE